MDLIKLLGVVLWLEIMARIVGPKDHGPYLMSFTFAEPQTRFEEILYASLPMAEDD